MNKTIWGNMIVRNEDNYIWFAIKSVVNYLDKLLIYDTGSLDKTIDIINLLQKEYPSKIIFKKKGSVNNEGLTKLRQEMLENTDSDWLLLIDGDEVWWEDSIKKTVKAIDESGKDLYALVNPTVNLIGDIFHFLEEEAGEYNILGKKGHFNIRAINRKIPSLHLKNSYPLEGFFDINDEIIQAKEEKLKFVDAPILHFSFLKRSSIDDSDTLHRKKIKVELGETFPNNFKYPEVLYLTRPKEIPDPFKKMKFNYKLRASVITPLKKLKRRFSK